jgi:predicted dehydrogenase
MIRVAVVGLGKMGLSLHSIINAHDGVEVAAVCDTVGYVLDVLNKYTGIKTYTDYGTMLEREPLDAVIIATPSRAHYKMVRAALDKGLHVYCEKPFTLNPHESQELSDLAEAKGLVNQVGYHYRFVGAFQEVKRLLDVGAIGKISHALAEAYGPVVLKPKGSTWRTKGSEGGGCIYDYAAHPLNLLNWYFGMPKAVSGTALNRIYSKETEDEVLGTLYFENDVSAQLSVNWSDESYRKMSTKITVWGSLGRIYADRQEVQVYFRDTAAIPEGYSPGWNVRYTTDLTKEVNFYVRGEEYSAELDYFARAAAAKQMDNISSFAAATETDRVIAMMVEDFRQGPRTATASPRTGR